jgi:tRNA threonylcarbamoyladenosine biosynthesis protein TsaB
LLILALDTTTRGGSVAVTEDDRVLAAVAGDASRTHAERLPAEMARALELAKVARSQIDLLAVATGPGAFTGLRIGLAAMQGLAMTLQKPVAGISALDALAEQAMVPGTPPDRSDFDLVVPWMDAQRGDVFATIIDARTRAAIEAPTTASPASLVDAWRAHLEGRSVLFMGDAAQRDTTVISHDRWHARVPDVLAPQIASLARRAAERGEAGPPHALSPIYVRKPDAEIERERRNAERAEGGRRA